MNVFELFAKLTLDSKDYEDKLNKSKDEAESKGGKIGSAFSKAGKVALAGMTAAAAGVGALVKSSVSAYADYEQLVGGVETLFSSLDGSVSAASDVMANAANAYKTAGLSANEYMETVTSFSAALVSSLNGDYSEAARISDMAITDMADNANKMGTSMESIQTAYQGFAKQNYTMLDNLKLGYGGTKQEMERLLEDAEKFSGVHYDIENLNDVYEAIHIVQKELGIAGATADEAEKTISGSANMMKGAWQNLVVGIADDAADFDTLINNLVESVGKFAGNILPRISKALVGVGNLVTQLAPQIATAIPALITELLPSLTSAAFDLVMALGNGIIENLPALMAATLEVILAISNGLAENIPELVPTIVAVMVQIVETLIDNLDLLVEAAFKIIVALAEALIQELPNLLAKAPEIIGKLVQAIIGAVGQLLQAAKAIVSALAQGIAGQFSVLIQKGKEILNSVKQGILGAISSLADVGMNIVRGIWNGISNGLQWIKDKISGWVGNVLSFIKNLFGISSPSKVMRDEVGVFLAKGIGVGFEKEMPNVERMMQDAIPDLSTSFAVNGRYDYARSTARNDNLADAVGIAVRNALRDVGIYLDTGVLVGAVDSGLQTRAMTQARRALA